MLLTPNLNDYEQNQPIAPAIYDAEVLTASAGTSKNGNPTVKIELNVETDSGRRKRTVNIPVTGKGVFRWVEFIRAAGFTEVADAYDRKDPVPFDITSLVGCKLRVRIEASTYNGQPSDEVKSYLPAA